LPHRLSQSPIIPVVAINNPDHGVPLAKTLKRGGIEAIEVTLRTPQAIDAIKAIKNTCPDIFLGVGTVLTPDDVRAAVDAGADFLVSPGVSPKLEAALLESGLLALPGVATPSEALARFDAGFEILKLFPAEAVGGVPILKSMYGPMPKLQFMPTGGVRPSNMNSYYDLPNVISVGGTWIATESAIDNQNWALIEDNCKSALAQITQ